MKRLIASDAVRATMPREINRFYNFLVDELDFSEIRFAFDDNDNPLSFIVVITVDDLPPIKYSLIADTFAQRSIYFKVLYAIKARMIERDKIAEYARKEIENGLATYSPPSTNSDKPKDEIGF